MVSSDLSYIAQSLSSYTVILEGAIALKWSGVGEMGLQMRISCIWYLSSGLTFPACHFGIFDVRGRHLFQVPEPHKSNNSARHIWVQEVESSIRLQNTQECGEESPTPPLSHILSLGKNKFHDSDRNLCGRVYVKNNLYPVSSLTLSGYGTWVLCRMGASHKGHSWKPPSEADLQIWTLLQKILPLVTVPISVHIASHLCHWTQVMTSQLSTLPLEPFMMALIQLSSEYRLISWHCWRRARKTGDSVSLTNEGTGEVIHLQTESKLRWEQVRLELEGELVTIQKSGEGAFTVVTRRGIKQQ